MMIGVEKTPAHPIVMVHRPKDRVDGGKRAAISSAEVADDGEQLITIQLKLCWTSAADALLNLSHGFNAPGPFKRYPQRYPLHHRSLKQA